MRVLLKAVGSDFTEIALEAREFTTVGTGQGIRKLAVGVLRSGKARGTRADGKGCRCGYEAAAIYGERSRAE
jgi:hypothetical protein